MADQDLLFRLGFESHPRANASLETLAKVVEETEKRIERVFTRIGAHIETTAAKANRVGGRAGGSLQKEPAMPAGVATEEATMEQLVARLRELETKMTADQQKGQQTRVQASDLYTAQMQAAGRARIITMDEEHRMSIKALEQLHQDMDRINAARIGGGAAAAGMSEYELAAAIGRVAKFNQVAQQKIQEREREEARHRKKTQMEEKQAEAEKARAAKTAATEAKRLMREEEQDRKRAIQAMKAVQQERRKMEVENQQLAKDAALPWIQAYEQEVTAADRANREIIRSKRQLLGSFNSSSIALGKLARSAVLLGLANGEAMEQVVRQLAAVQAGIDFVSGSVTLYRSVAQAFNALVTIKRAGLVVAQAEAAAGRVAVAGSGAVKTALDMETLSARQAAAAHELLARSRAAAGGAGGARSSFVVGGGAVAARGRGAGGAIAGSVLGGAAGAAGGAYVGQQVGGDNGGMAGAVLGGVMGTALGNVAGGIISKKIGGAMAATAMGGAGKAIAGAFVGALKVAGGAIATVFTGAVVGVAAVVAGAILTPALLGLRRDRKELAESEKRVERAQAQLDHNRKLSAINRQAAGEIASVRAQFDDERSNRQIDRAPDDAARMGLMDRLRAQRLEELKKARSNVNDTVGRNADGSMFLPVEHREQSLEALRGLEDAEKRFQHTLDKELEIRKRIADQDKRDRLDQIAGIENVIRARVREREELENQFLSAKERFGRLSVMEQQLALKALEEARNMNPQEISDQQAQRIGQIGTKESERILTQRANARADAAGFDQRAGGEFRQERQRLFQENEADLQRLGRISGQDVNQLRTNAQNPAQVEIVDRQQFEVTMNALNERIFERLVTEFNASLRRNEENMKRRIQALADEEAEKETQAFGKASTDENIR